MDLPKVKAWLSAVRIRTLPLSVAGIIVGTSLANSQGYTDNLLFILALFTAIMFQITSNLANDYGDGIKGTDGLDRIGPQRMLQSGLLSKKELSKGIILSSGISILLVLILVLVAFGSSWSLFTVLFLVLGVFCIWAAIKYTVGKSAYGYKGWGDFFVFVFFGLLAVLGSMFLYTKQLNLEAFLPACTIGLLSVGVLNLNNLRDSETDKKAGKNTLVVKMGFGRGKVYHLVLLITAFICLATFILLNLRNWVQAIPLLGFVPIFMHMSKVYRTQTPMTLDPELKKLALSTFLLALLIYFGFNYFL